MSLFGAPSGVTKKRETEATVMKRLSPALSALYLVLMIAVVVSVDVAFFQHHPEIRLIGNIVVVALFAGGYFLLARLKK